MGKLIVIEGTDGSGKSTQFRLLTQRLQDEGTKFQKLVFPQYAEPSSALIRMYLGGEFGSHPDDVNAYAASAFYAVDRYASYKKVWGMRMAAWFSLTATPPPTLSTRHPRSPRSVRGIFSNGCMSLSMTSWACPARIW